jgi:squalene synthase HpnC
MTVSTVSELHLYGPATCRPMPRDQAEAWCLRLASRRHENFPVLSSLVPCALRSDFAAIYAFCRWADDLSDEIGDPAESRRLLAWWRAELDACFAGRPRHPVFAALAGVIERHELPPKPFHDLITAFEHDQATSRYETWDELLAYCRGSANPVGRLVMMVCGEPRTDDRFEASDAICTALQLTNHWQDIQRDILERDRIYVPRELIQIDDFERRLRVSAKQRFAVDHRFLAESRELVRQCVERTWPLFERGQKLLDLLQPTTRPLVWLFTAGGQHVLRQIEMWNYETAIHRPTIGRSAKAMLVARAWVRVTMEGWRARAAS